MKHFMALLALGIFVAHMLLHVNVPVPLERKGPLAMAAFKGLFSSVHSCVSGQLVWVGKGPYAELAFVGPLCSVWPACLVTVVNRGASVEEMQIILLTGTVSVQVLL